MIKKLDILLLRQFVGPFILLFFIALFVLVMQFFWLYMDDLLGKGLGTGIILELLLYMAATLVPLALPLGILLSSIMTFGSMGEYYELVAIKSSGISLLRFMRPLFVFISCISVLGFFFNNNVIPVANLKAFSLLWDLRNSKPTLNIRPGMFNNDITNYAIRVGSKDEDGRTLRNIIIYDHSAGGGISNDRIVLAKKGTMMSTADKHYMVFRLEDGWRYQEGMHQNAYGDARHETQVRMHFRQWDKVFDLSNFKITRTDEDLFKDGQTMMNVQQLLSNRKLAVKDHQRDIKMNERFMSSYITTLQPAPRHDSLMKALNNKSVVQALSGSFLDRIPAEKRHEAAANALSSVRNLMSQFGFKAEQEENYYSRLRKFDVEFHQKFTLSFGCLLLFLIGAPLGSIIRKGGIGLPLIFAILFFLVYHLMSISGRKLALAGKLDPAVGMWMSTAFLLPIALVLIQQARNDSQLFARETYARLIAKLRFRKKKS